MSEDYYIDIHPGFGNNSIIRDIKLFDQNDKNKSRYIQHLIIFLKNYIYERR